MSARSLFIWVLVLLLLRAGKPAALSPQRISASPSDGRELLSRACVQCHDLRIVFAARKSERAWKRTINEMIWRGALLFPGEADLLARYLTRRGLNREATSPSEGEGKLLPEGKGRALLERACLPCHDAAELASHRKTKAEWRRTLEDMLRLGASLTPSEREHVLDYLVAAFGRDESKNRR